VDKKIAPVGGGGGVLDEPKKKNWREKKEVYSN